MKRFSLLFSFTVLAAACGGSDKPVAQEPTDTKPAMGEEPKLTPELDAFHETLGPKWHAEKGEARTKDTCGAIGDFQAKAAAVHAAPAPAGVDGSAWTDAGGELETSVTALATACSTNDAGAFETSFEQVHNAFHKAMELAMPAGAHDEHMGHEGHEGHEGPAAGEPASATPTTP